MKKAGVRFTNDLVVSFDYDEDTNDINVLVVDGSDRYTGSVTLTQQTRKTAKKTTTK